MMRREKFSIANIYVPIKRRATLKPETVQEIAQSILEVGGTTKTRSENPSVIISPLFQLVLTGHLSNSFPQPGAVSYSGGRIDCKSGEQTPKLTAIAVGALNDQDFYNRLERAVERSERVLNAKLIEGHAIRDE
jgi:hypothetical protein